MTSHHADKESKAKPTRKPTQDSSAAPDFDSGNLLDLQRVVGNQAVQRLMAEGKLAVGSNVLQAKLTVGAPDDQYEQEADSVAQQVMTMPDSVQRDPAALDEEEQPLQMKSIQREDNVLDDDIPVQAKHIQREEQPEQLIGDAEDEFGELEEIGILQMRSASGSTPEVTEDIESGIEGSRGSGQAMPDSAREFFEPRFGQDFSGVQIHTGAEADSLNRSLEARAFTTGSDIYFRDGEYNPSSDGGRELLAHELTHVVQQGGSARRKPAISRKPEISQAQGGNQVINRAILNFDSLHLEPLVHSTRDSLFGLPTAISNKTKKLGETLLTSKSQTDELRHEHDWLNHLAMQGENQLDEVQAVESKLGKKAKGEKGKYIRDAVENYINTNKALPGLLNTVKATQNGIKAKASHVKEVVLAGQILKSERDVEDKQGKVDAVKSDMESTKQWATGIFGLAVDLLDVKKWGEAGIKVGAFLGEKLVEAGVEAAYAPDLNAAKQQLEAAQAGLKGFQDEKQKEMLIGATHELDQANDEATAAQDNMIAAAMRAEQSETTLIETLRGLGMEDAAAALERRSDTNESSDAMLRLLADYAKTLETVKNQVVDIRIYYTNLLQLINPSTVPNDNRRETLVGAAINNDAVMRDILDWSNAEKTEVGNLTNTIGNASKQGANGQPDGYMVPYNNMDKALQDAVTLR